MEENKDPKIFTSQKKWRQWLERNHNKCKVVWVALKKKNSEKKCINYAEALDEALCFGWIDGVMNKYNEDFFKQRFTPRKSGNIWSLINKEKVEKLIIEGKMTEAGLKKIEEAKKSGAWQKAYSSNSNNKIPDDLISSLNKVPGAYDAFCRFPPSHQRMYIHWLNDAKKEETRLRRIEKIILWSFQKKNPNTL
jgi:uncharacterized protein YdeI (YjbR/CyaY-like superfamily)